VSNLLFARIILNRSWYQKGKFGKVTEQSHQRSWAGISAGNADIWGEFLRNELPQLYGMFIETLAEPDAGRGAGAKDGF